jgi:hypothetical protein
MKSLAQRSLAGLEIRDHHFPLDGPPALCQLLSTLVVSAALVAGRTPFTIKIPHDLLADSDIFETKR